MVWQALYEDIAKRTDGDVYIGVVGPVRTGKSTFIKRFMEQMVLPGVDEDARRQRMIDELPQSGDGRTIMTTQPRFVPNEAVNVTLDDQAELRVRLVDCVGYLIRGALGLNEGESARMVRTPWFDHDIPFETAAEVGTRKVIRDHSTVGVLVTTDGSFTEFPRASYVEAEERVVRELKEIGRPFVVALNCLNPESDEASRLRGALAEKYDVPVLAINAQEMDAAKIGEVLEKLLNEFPLTEAVLSLPEWVGALPDEHWLPAALLEAARKAAEKMHRVRDHEELKKAFSDCEYLGNVEVSKMRLGEGGVDYKIALKDGLFYRVLGEASGQRVDGEEHLLRLMTEMTQAKKAYDRVSEALKAAEETGYGLVTPSMDELKLEQPEIVRQGSRFGVRLRASAPSLHLIRVDIETSVSPIVGTEQQSEELVRYLLSEFENDPSSIWSTNIFGKSLSDLMREGLSGKLSRMPDDVRKKLKESLERIINEGSGGMICILL